MRHQVFVGGQGVPVELERDGLDGRADHAVATVEGQVVATGRLVASEGEGGRFALIGRMAVLPDARGTGLGAAVLRALEDRAVELSLPTVELHAQTSAEDFYARVGYTRVGDTYAEAGLEHVTMRKPLPVLRDVRDGDSAALIALIGGCWAEYPGVLLDIDGEEPWLRAPASAYSGWSGRAWVIELAGQVVACCGVKPAEPDAVELKSMYVARAARRRGLARRLEALVLGEARKRGVDRVELWSDSRFADAHETYTQLGYTRLPHTRELHDLSQTVEFPFVKQLPVLPVT